MRNWFKQLGVLVLVNLKGYFREPAIIFWALVFPAGIAGVLGVAFQGKPPAVPVAIVGQTHAALAWKASLDETQGEPPSLQFQVLSESDALTALKRGDVQLYISVSTPPHDGFAEPVAHYDPGNPQARLGLLSLEKLLYKIKNPEISGERVLEEQVMDEIGGRYIDFLIPGLLALGIMNSCMWGMGYGLIDLRVKKLLRRMAASPMYKSAFMASHFCARMVFTISEALILFVFAHFLFGVRVEGSLFALALLFVAGNLAWSGIGMLASSRGQSMNAANGIVNAVTLPMTMLSGIFFSYRNFPDWSQKIIEWLPLTVLADSIRSIFIEGAGLAQMALPIGVLMATGMLFALLAVRLYRWH